MALLASLFWPQTEPRPLVQPRGRWAALAWVLVGSGLLALAARVRVPLPFTPVPVTGQTFAVLVLAAALGARRGVQAVLLYLAWGALGLPVFSQGGGAAYLLGPTGGYLWGFVAMAAVVGALAERTPPTSPRFWAAFFLGEAALYAMGLLWLAGFVGGLARALKLGLWPFVLPDALKGLAAAMVAAALYARRPARRPRA